ncbi:MAG: TatD family hydrolase [Patescibacteria group bacterium]|nr:TatD family hydrolase [Patescibacteria group bacterium]
MLIDTHVHLDFKHFDKDRGEVIQRALDAGVERMVNIGCDVRTSDASVVLAHEYDCIFATVGIHPHDSDQWGDDVANKFIVQAKDEKMVAIGEIGLDYYHMRKPEEVQKKAFAGQLALAREVSLPVVVHIRDAARDAYDILVESGLERVILHCFNEDLEFAEKCWAKGWITGFGGPVTYPNNERLREVVEMAPSKQFVLETDCPFLPPQAHRGQRNEPAYVKEVLEEVEKIRGERMEVVYPF